MAWVAIGSTVAATATAAVLGGGGGSGGSPSVAADPFAGQREQYQTALQSLMQGNNGGQDYGAFAKQRQLALGLGTSNPQQTQMNQMLQPGGAAFIPSDPSYQFRLSQGLEGVNRGAAKSGMLDSGNRLAALQAFGQGMASTEYQSQFQRLQSAATTNAQLEQQQFGQLGQVDQTSQNLFQNNYARLAQLSGANSGSPGMAGQLLQQQQAGSAAQFQQWGNLAVQGAQSLWNSATASTPAYATDPSYGQYANSSAPVQAADNQTW